MQSKIMPMGKASRIAGCVVLHFCLVFALHCPADDLSVSNLLAAGDLRDQVGDTQAALNAYLEAARLAPQNAEIHCRLTKQYCDCMHNVSEDKAKAFAQKALASALEAVKADPRNAKAHVCAAVGFAKNFPYLDNQTRVDYSRQIKTEAEKAISLDPNFDLAYHMLGRWNFEVANMNIFVKGIVRIAYGGLPKASRELAIENFKKAVALLRGRLVNHLQLARCYHVTGRESLAQTELKQCAALSPLDKDDQDAREIAKRILRDGKWSEVR
jgi:tetratricopeptide (TPR) repeat protein